MFAGSLRYFGKGRGRRVFAIVLFAIISWNGSAVFAQEKCRMAAGFGIEAPYHFPNEQGKIIGIDADILRIVLADLGCALVYRERPWKRTLVQIKDGDLDVTLGASFKEERAKFAHYSVPYRGQPHVLFEDKAPGSGAATLVAFLKSGRSLGVVLGWHYTNKIRALLDDPVYRPVCRGR